jgi:hypothetical protein
MLTVAQCREYLDEETSVSMTDAEITRVRDDLYVLARLVAERINKSKLQCRIPDSKTMS